VHEGTCIVSRRLQTDRQYNIAVNLLAGLNTVGQPFNELMKLTDWKVFKQTKTNINVVTEQRSLRLSHTQH
jgi:hypothetical protein